MLRHQTSPPNAAFREIGMIGIIYIPTAGAGPII